MACNLTTTRQAGVICGNTRAGLDELKHWLIDRSKITFGGLTPGTRVFTTMTIVGTGSALLPWNFDKRGFDFTDEMSVDENTGAITHSPTIHGRMIGLDGANAADVEELKNTNLVSIFMTKAGKFIVAGYKSGLTLTTNTTGATSEALGETVTIGSTDEPEKHYEFLDTDQATTLAALIAAETPVV